MQVSLQYAQEHFPDLVSAVYRGEVVEIAQPEQPTLQLVVSAPAPRIKIPGKRILGAGRGEMRVPSFEEWQALDQEMKSKSADAPLMTTGEV